MSGSDVSSALIQLRGRLNDLSDHVGSWRFRIGGVVLLALVGVGLWGLIGAGGHAARASTDSGYSSRSYSTTTLLDDTPTTQAAHAVVYAAGAVNSPGLYTVAADARVGDVINAAGGLSSDADPDRVNLAAKISDGQRVYVARKGQSVPDDGTGDAGAATDATGASAGPVNINDASAQELDSLPGVGPSTAAAIVAYRSAHGPFKSINDLANVKGIGPAKLAAIKDHITV